MGQHKALMYHKWKKIVWSARMSYFRMIIEETYLCGVFAGEEWTTECFQVDTVNSGRVFGYYIGAVLDGNGVGTNKNN